MKRQIRRLGMVAAVLLLAAPAIARDQPVPPKTDIKATPDAENFRACAATPSAVIVHVTNVKSNLGNVKGELWNHDPDTFLDKKFRLYVERFQAVRGTTEFCLPTPGPGVYAVTVYHDENGNKKFDKNFLGIPKEGYGFSNNPGFPLRRPRHSELSFKISSDPHRIEITLNY